jgi:toxin ParE1/3/4
MKVHWTDTAEAHLDAIYAYIAQDSKTYALRIVDRITKRSQQIGEFPLSGRKVPEYEHDQIPNQGSVLRSITESYITLKQIKLM